MQHRTYESRWLPGTATPSRWQALAIAMAVGALMLAMAGSARAQTRTPFDHLTTGFELIGQHRDLPCESCHVNAIFKGTPRECAACHGVGTAVRATAKPVSHILSSNACEACHTPVAWSPAVNFDHAEVRGSCDSCHNGVQAQGKGPTHIETNLQCDVCHSTIGWAGAVFNHVGVTSGCASCHNGVSAKGPPPQHIPTGPAADPAAAGNAPCESCHAPTNYVTFSGTRMNHDIPQIKAMRCDACHEAGMSFFGVSIVTRPPPPHPVAGTGDCSACHFDTVSFKGVGQPAGHIPTSQPCVLCHSNAADYTVYAMKHDGITSDCAQCHAAGLSFTGVWTTPLKAPPTNHLPFGSAACESCHSPSNFTTFMMTNASGTAPPAMVHSAVPGAACATCHAAGLSFVGTPATKAPPANHVPFGSAACESCHSPTNFTSFQMTNATGTAPPAMVHTGVSSTACSTCHEAGLSWVGAPPTVLRPPYLVAGNPSSGAHPTTGECSNCHTSTVSFLGASIFPSNHIPVPGGSSSNCNSCHSNSSNYAVYNMDHSVVTGTACAACHGAGKAFANMAPPTLKLPPSNHVPFGTAACESCHSPTNFTTFQMTNASGTAPPSMVHSAVSGTACATCHAAGLSFVGTPATKVLPSNHVPIGTAACEACHSPTNFTSFQMTNASGTAPPAMVHSAVSGMACSGCHAAGLSFIGTPATKVLPSNHVPIGTATCQSCHTPTNFTTFQITNATGTAPPAMVHTAVSSTACSACHEAGLSWVGAPPTVLRPQYLVPGNPASGPHVTGGECSSCHFNTVSFAGASNYPANHIPVPAADNNNCALCHSNANDYSISAMNHVNISSNCAQCHASGLSFAGVWTTPLKAPPGNHVPFGTAACEACHSPTNFTTFQMTNASGTAPPSMVHSAVSGTACATCHAAGKSFVGTPATKVLPSNHVPIGTAACEACHSPTNFTSFQMTNASGTAPPAMVHSAVSSTACSTCHEAGKTWVGTPVTVVRPQYLVPGNSASGLHPATGECSQCHLNTVSFAGAVSYPSGHIPNPGGASSNCALCHTTGDYSVYVMNHTGITTNCAQCHAYGLTFTGVWTTPLVAPPAGATGHIPSNPPNGTLNIACEACHSATVFMTFSGTIMRHAKVPTMQCMACHELGMKWKTNTGVSLWVRDGADHYKGQDCGGSGCHSTRDKYAKRRVLSAATQKSGVVTRAGDAAGNSIAITGGAGAGGAASFDHRRVAGTACVSCHGVASGAGKPPSHIATTDSCQNCHGTLAWLPVTMVDHMQVLGSCVSCHNGRAAPGKGSNHIVSGDDCTTCHTTNAWTPARFDHAGVAAHTCRNCHDAVHATGMPANHVPTSAQCDTCHGTLAWIPAKLDHTALTSNCVSCHNNNVALGVPPAHMSTQRDCALCHSYPDWTVLHFVHASASYPGAHKVALTCASCHTSNTDQIPWPSPAQAGSCAGCHAKDYRPDLHPKTATGVKYTVDELRDCTGACHVYADAKLETIVKSVPGPYHRVTDAAFKH